MVVKSACVCCVIHDILVSTISGWYCRWVSSAGVGFLLLAWGGCRRVDWFHWSWRWLLVTVLSLSVVCQRIVFSSNVVATVSVSAVAWCSEFDDLVSYGWRHVDDAWLFCSAVVVHGFQRVLSMGFSPTVHLYGSLWCAVESPVLAIVICSCSTAKVCHCQWSVWCTLEEVGCYELSDSSVGAGGLLAFWLVRSLHPSPAAEPFPPVMPCANPVLSQKPISSPTLKCPVVESENQESKRAKAVKVNVNADRVEDTLNKTTTTTTCTTSALKKLSDKVCKLKNKYKTNVTKAKLPSNPHNQQLYDLSQKFWDFQTNAAKLDTINNNKDVVHEKPILKEGALNKMSEIERELKKL
ncbi:hypothetical protein LOK49_LG14G01579 [Camellia lanceoleosa]|uniref:Uncharacterized protein n=1 Tax=Camellia lanceoleosa TaxID=1840588 RepID=A0ACC0FE38_9ERIC|nr:hypothetical protein LOK49_LG14G01579 [Camellia lanceoleosa]